MQLAAAIADRHQRTVTAACAQLPTITKIGMAALLPGANDDFRVSVMDDQVVPTVKGRAMAGLPQRLEYIKEVVGPNRFAAIELDEVVTEQTLPSLAHVEVLVVRTSTIDQLGESNPKHLVQLLPSVVRELHVALNRLADAGFSAAVLATDHGFCWFDSVDNGDAIKKPDGPWVQVKNRSLLGAGQPSPQTARFEAADVGIRGNVEHYVAARGMATFTRGVQYFHEGLSPQECVLPIVQVALKPAALAGVTAPVSLVLTYRGAKTGTITTLRPSVEVSVPLSDLFGPADVTFVLQGFDSGGRKVADVASNPNADAATGQVQMAAGQSIKVPIRIEEGFDGSFELRAANPGTNEIYATLTLSTDFHH
jgi:hypothetical protein